MAPVGRAGLLSSHALPAVTRCGPPQGPPTGGHRLRQATSCCFPSAQEGTRRKFRGVKGTLLL